MKQFQVRQVASMSTLPLGGHLNALPARSQREPDMKSITEVEFQLELDQLPAEPGSRVRDDEENAASSRAPRTDLPAFHASVDLVKFPKELTVPFWKDCSPDLVAQVIRDLVVRVHLPGDFVLHQREISDELFMINRGTCELTHPPIDPHGGLQWDQLFSTKHSSGSLQRTRRTNSTTGEPAKIPPKPDQVAAEADRDCSLKPNIMHPGEHAIVTEGLPFSMGDVYGISIVKPSSVGATSVPGVDTTAQPNEMRDRVDTQRTSTMSMTPAQTADFLMRKINCQVCDTSIKFGFQQVDLAQDDECTPSGTRSVSQDASSDGLLPTSARQTLPVADEPAPRSPALIASFSSRNDASRPGSSRVDSGHVRRSSIKSDPASASTHSPTRATRSSSLTIESNRLPPLRKSNPSSVQHARSQPPVALQEARAARRFASDAELITALMQSWEHKELFVLSQLRNSTK
ncbi:hypothetical protein FI667_g8714, partial [Globisporangium splendens]